MLLGSADTTNGGATIRALALGDRLTILGQALDGIFHFFLSLALYAICFDCHGRKTSLFERTGTWAHFYL